MPRARRLIARRGFVILYSTGETAWEKPLFGLAAMMRISSCVKATDIDAMTLTGSD